jgi:hypothetical protein
MSPMAGVARQLRGQPAACCVTTRAGLWALTAGASARSLVTLAVSIISTYAQQFYQAAVSGHTLGEAARQARDAIRHNPGDPTWLAYTLYADPAATISTAPMPSR